MKHDEIARLMESVAPTIGDFVSKAIAPLRAENARLSSELAAVEQRFADFSTARENDKVFFLTLVKEEVAKIELPINEVDPAEIERVVSDKVEKAVSALPAAVNGKDADPVDLDEVAIRAAKLVPVPENGKDADIEVVRSIIMEEVAKVAPENGKDSDPAEVAKLLVELMPIPADGKSVTLDDVKPLLEEMVLALPKPENGKDADPEMVLRLVEETVAKVQPAPAGKDGEPGKSVEIEDLIPVICAEIENAFKSLDPPKDGEQGIPGQDGKSVSIEEVIPVLEEIAGKKLPNSFLVNESGSLVAIYSDGQQKSVGKVRGEDGLRGASVMDGHVDESGTLVLRMSDGRIIQTGVVRGEAGEDGKDGQKGERGRDANEIQILPGVDENKSYVEGVVALWRGGVIRSERQTDPIIDGDVLSAGWKVFVRGIADEYEETVEDGRFVERTTIYTDGSEFKRRSKTVTPIYRGVWKEGPYLKGDMITWAGSTFIAQRDNNSEKPEVTDAWRLATKRGRDGKDGRIDRPPPTVKLDPDKR